MNIDDKLGIKIGVAVIITGTLAMLSVGYAAKREREIRQPLIGRINALADINQNGSLSKEEWDQVYHSLGKKTRSDYLFRKYGPDGGLSPEDMRNYIKNNE